MKIKISLKIKTKKIFLFLLLIFTLSLFPSFAQQFLFEQPVAVTSKGTYFPEVLSSSLGNYLFYEKKEGSSLFIEMKSRSKSEKSWSQPKKIAGPFAFGNDVPNLYSAQILEDETIAVAVSSSEYEIEILCSKDSGKTFSSQTLSLNENKVVAPRLFVSSSGKFVLFVSMENQNKFSIAWSISSDGKVWQNLESFKPLSERDSCFSPFVCPVPHGDIIVFQEHFSVPNRIKTFQIFSIFSNDDFNSFSEPVLITDDSISSSTAKDSFANYTNQNPSAFFDGEKCFLSFERSSSSFDDGTWICVSEITTEGTRPYSSMLYREFKDYEKSHGQKFYSLDGTTFLLWYDKGEGVIQSSMTENNQFERPYVLEDSKNCVFPYPVQFTIQGRISFLWQNQENGSRIWEINQDTYAPPPVVSPLNFTENKPSNKEDVKVNLIIPQDRSGIFGYTWCFTQNEDEQPSTEEYDLTADRRYAAGEKIQLKAKAKEDGKYYFKVRVQDNGGNWSEPSSVSYTRDLTPPESPVNLTYPKDKDGFVLSNNFSFSWQADAKDEDTAGFVWSITKVDEMDPSFYAGNKNISVKTEQLVKFQEKIARSSDKYLKKAAKPQKKNFQKSSSKKFINLKNGIYVFSVAAVDYVGNTGKSSSEIIAVNRYKPATKITGLQMNKDIFGNIELSIFGNDFNFDGTINEIIIKKLDDADSTKNSFQSQYEGKKFLLAKKDYNVESNSKISGLKLGELEEGSYGIFLNHSSRGIYPSNKNIKTNQFKIEESGTVVIQYPYKIDREWEFYLGNEKITVKVQDILLILLFFLAFFTFIVSVREIIKTVKEHSLIKTEVEALLKGEIMPTEKKEIDAAKIEKLKSSGSLKIKLVGFTALLVLSIVVMVSVSLGKRMISTQKKTLTDNMQEQVFVLLEGMANGIQNAKNDAINGNGTFGLTEIVRQAETFSAALESTLIGPSMAFQDDDLSYFWASTLKSRDISAKLDTAYPEPGKSRFVEGTEEKEIEKLCRGLEKTALSETEGLIASLSEKYDAELKTELTQKFRELSRQTGGAVPEFSENTVSPENSIFTFYYPVFYKETNQKNLLQGILLLKVDVSELLDSIRSSRNAIIYISIVVAAVTILIGCIASYILATLIVEPIKKLAVHVKKITDTKDKIKLKDFSIEIKSHDEIKTLGNAVNEMTEGLVKAAEEQLKAEEEKKLNLDAQAVQKTFLPLTHSEEGGQKTTTDYTGKAIKFFGYYEGADEVSGDYFDYKKLDDRFYAIIKGDVSGHGVPAALIMSVVATLFRQYFAGWTWEKNGIKIDGFISEVNDFIEGLGVKGKFATMLLCLFDTKTGDSYICNAGDNIIHIYDGEKGLVKTVTLNQTPAAGALPAFLVEMKGGYKTEKITLKKNDILFLYTDGIEESTRFFRNKDYQVVPCQYNGLKSGEVHENHKTGQESEQLESDRVIQIIEAALNKKQFVLKKHHNPEENENLTFDFSKLEGTVQDAVLSLAGVEKVFRLYKTKGATGKVYATEKGAIRMEGAVVRVDRKIDGFLKKCFNRYDYYCSQQQDLQEENYIYYCGVEEDRQADDLTLLGIQKL